MSSASARSSTPFASASPRRVGRATPLHPPHHPHPAHARASRAARCCCLSLLPAGVGAGAAHALAREDPREHGDRPQRPARPVGLGAATPTIHSTTLGVGHRLSRSRLWKHTHNDMHHTWTNVVGHGSRPRATASSDARLDEQPWQPALLAPADPEPRRPGHVLRVGHRVPRPRDRALQSGREGFTRGRGELTEGRSRQGPGAGSPRTTCCSPRSAGRSVSVRSCSATFAANTIRNVWAYVVIFCGHFPDGRRRLHRRDPRRRDARRLVRPSAPRLGATSTAARSCTS